MKQQPRSTSRDRAGAPRKSLGQHFLTDRNLLGAIADAAGVGPGDTVIEVGPGRGALTEVLAARAARVIALELDEALAGALRDAMPPNVTVVHADARQAEPSVLLDGCRAYKLAGNLPYYAAMPILRRFLEGECPPTHAAVLVQREVAQEMCARPGDMSLLSLAVQIRATARVVRLVRPGAFNPPPKVTSAVVALEVRGKPVDGIDDPDAFFVLARAAFSARRKQLRNALSQGLGIPGADADALLRSAGIEQSRRAETLSWPEWVALYRAWRAR